jgi:hypothetical protein
MAFNFNPWGYVIIIGCLIVMYLIFFKIDSGLKRPTDISRGKVGNEHFWGWEEKPNSMFPQATKGGKRKRKLRRKPRR